MKRQVLFTQGAGRGAHELDGKLVASLQDSHGIDDVARSAGYVVIG